jgi:cyclopropane fatty-acyl-phospholipid synthase-like methyltransferase
MQVSDFVEVKNPRAASHYRNGKASMGHFVEDYINERVDINIDLMELLKHKDELFTYDYIWHHYSYFISRMIPEVVIHSKKQDERIVRSHYDNKNDLFNWFLGPRMIYTSCYFEDQNETLEAAQDNKMNLIARKMQLKAGESLLDIGCGWGTLVAHMAKYYGVDATGVTIAQAGADWGTRQIGEYGVSPEQARIWRMDYRDIPKDKKYDKITCLEMAEHVGIKYFRKFMDQIYDMLKDDGLFYLQIAGLRERDSLFQKKNQEDLVWGLFMSEYIFSGADASMPLNWDLRRIEKAGFEVHSVENIGIHYGKTIHYWYDNWISNKEKVLEKYGEKIFRIYSVFLGWSVFTARQGGSTAYQIVCRKNLNNADRNRFIGKTNLGEMEPKVAGV